MAEEEEAQAEEHIRALRKIFRPEKKKGEEKGEAGATS